MIAKNGLFVLSILMIFTVLASACNAADVPTTPSQDQQEDSSGDDNGDGNSAMETPKAEDSTDAPSGSPDDSSDDSSSSSSTREEISGVVQVFDSYVITIDGITYDISNSAEIEGNITVGSYVKVKLATLSDGTMVAIEIELEDMDNSGNYGDDSDDYDDEDEEEVDY